MLEVAVLYRDHVAKKAMTRARSSLRNYEKEGGIITKMDKSAQQAWANSMPNIAVEWATSLDKKGEPGSEMLRAYMAKLARAGYMPIRDWSAELP